MRRRPSLLLIVAIGASICGVIIITSFQKASKTTDRLKVISTNNFVEEPNSKEERPLFAYDNINNVIEVAKEEKVLSDPNAKGCVLEKVDPFSKVVMNHMFDLGSLDCPPYKSHVKAKFNATHIHVSGDNIDEMKYRKIGFDDDGFFDFGDYQHVIAQEIAFIKGKNGVIRNEASYRCIAPSSTEYGKTDITIELKYTMECRTPHVLFAYDQTGAIKHLASGLCVAPNIKPPADNTQLVLSKDCSSTFTILDGGVLKFDSAEMCIHPLWGGAVPEEDQRLCLWSDCKASSRLQYHLYAQPSVDDTKEIIRKINAEAGELSVISNRTDEDKFFFINLLPQEILTENKDGVNIFMISFDEVSQAHFQRKVPKTLDWMKKHMKFSFVDSYASVSSSLNDNIMAFLDGNTESTETSVYKLAKEKGYATLFASDSALKKGVIQAHHNSAAFLNALARKAGIKQCFQGRKKFDMTFDHANSFVQTYASNPKFSFIVFAELSKSNFNFFGYIDESLKNYLQSLHKLKSTVILINSVKGSLAGRLGQLEQGTIEYRKPLLAIYISEDIKNQVFIKDHKTLVTPYDIYLTLIELLTKTRRKHQNGYSLFEKNIPERNCYQAGILKNMCPCRSR